MESVTACEETHTSWGGIITLTHTTLTSIGKRFQTWDYQKKGYFF